MQKKVVATIVIFSILRLFTASMLELGNDETYYWLYSQQLQWNYFDHPPLVALGIRFFTLNLAFDQQEVFVRLASIAGCALSSVFMYKAVTLISNQRAGWFSVILYNTSFYAGVVAGILIMPDAPQMVFWTFCLWMLARIARHDGGDWFGWIGFGIAAGLAIMSKVHSIFLWVGVGSFILLRKREWLTLPSLYVSVLLTLLIASPILWWNWQYDFITWRFHSERIDITEQVSRKDSFWAELLGQVLVNNPVNFMLAILATYALFKKRNATPLALSVYNFIAWPMAICLIIISFFRDIWPHWSGPAYTSLLPLTAIWLDQRKRKAVYPSALNWAIGGFLLFLIAWPLIVKFYPGTFGSNIKTQLGKGDFTLDKHGWKDAGEKFIELYYREQSAGNAPAGSPLVCSNWWGSHIEYYFGDDGRIPVIGLGDIAHLHQYAWLNETRENETDMSTGYCIISSIEKGETPAIYKDYYQHIDSITTIPVFRNKLPAQYFYVYRLSGWKNKQIPVAHKLR